MKQNRRIWQGITALRAISRFVSLFHGNKQATTPKKEATKNRAHIFFSPAYSTTKQIGLLNDDR